MLGKSYRESMRIMASTVQPNTLTSSQGWQKEGVIIECGLL